MDILESINQAVEYTKNKEFKKAEKIYLELLKNDPENGNVLSFLGLLYMSMNKVKKAEKYLQKALIITNNLALASHMAKIKFVYRKYDEALYFFIKALEKDKNLESFKDVINCAEQADKWTIVRQYAMEANALYPFELYFISMIAKASLFLGKYEDAKKYAEKCLRFDSKSTDAFDILGLLEEILYCNEETARKYYKLMIKHGDRYGGYHNLVTSYGKEKRYRRRCLYYLKKIARNPNIDPFCFASYFLTNRQFKRGFKFYVKRKVRNYNDYLFHKRFKAFWEGEKTKGETLLVHGDQGIGDQLMFSRYLPFLEKKFDKIKVKVHPSIVSLFKRSFKNCKKIKFFPHNYSSYSVPKHDKAVFLAHTPYYLNINFNHIPTPEGYLIPDKKKIVEYKNKYFNTDKFKIGICWEAGATGIREQIHRTLNVELFEDIITNTPNSQIYSFQVGATLDNYKKYKNLIDIGETIKDFDDTAAALQNLDILVTVDTSLAHVAGATGVKTIMILPYCTDWRWFRDEKNTDWYNSIRIVKQHVGEPWPDLFKRLRAVLDETIAASA